MPEQAKPERRFRWDRLLILIEAVLFPAIAIAFLWLTGNSVGTSIFKWTNIHPLVAFLLGVFIAGGLIIVFYIVKVIIKGILALVDWLTNGTEE